MEPHTANAKHHRVLIKENTNVATPFQIFVLQEPFNCIMLKIGNMHITANVWPIPILTNMFTALKGSQFYFYLYKIVSESTVKVYGFRQMQLLGK